jgi:soluble lytic murein transglycosylase-like protein
MDIKLEKGVFSSNGKMIIFVALILLVFVTYSYYLHDSIAMIREENKLLRIQTQNLAIFTEDKGRILKLEELLFANTNIMKFVKEDKVPSIVQKILGTAAKYRDAGLTPAQLLAIMEVESGFDPTAISRAKEGSIPVAYGLMQIVRSTATPILREMGYDWSQNTILIPEINIEVGTKYFMILHKQFVSMGLESIDEFHMSFIAYNRGERLVLESVDVKKKATVSLDYLGKVKMAEKGWKSKGF